MNMNVIEEDWKKILVFK